MESQEKEEVLCAKLAHQGGGGACLVAAGPGMSGLLGPAAFRARRQHAAACGADLPARVCRASEYKPYRTPASPAAAGKPPSGKGVHWCAMGCCRLGRKGPA